MSAPFLSLPFQAPLGNPASATSKNGSAQETDLHPDVPYEPLSISSEGGQLEGSSGTVTEQMGLKDEYQRSEWRYGDSVAQLAAIGSASVLVATTWIMGLANPPYGWFVWHPLLQTLGIAMFTYGILTLQPTSQPRTKAAGLLRHQLAMVALGFPTLILGTLAVVYHKYAKDGPHFTSWHGTIGIITMALGLLQVGLGAGSVWFDGRLFGGNPRAKFIWKYHRLSGYLIFPLYLISIWLGGAYSGWSSKHSVYIVRLLTFSIAPIVLFAALLVRVRTSKMKFF